MKSGTKYLQKWASDLIEDIDYLKVIPSYHCDRGCHYCYNNLLGQEASFGGNNLIDSIREFIREKRSEFVVEVLGGEPLCNDSIGLTISILREFSKSSTCRKKIIINSKKLHNE